MKIEDQIGWMNICLTDPSKSYVIGGSEEANEELRKKYLGDSYKIPAGAKAFDELEVKGISRIEVTSENYNDIMKVKGMPASCFCGEYGRKALKEIESMVRSYYSGELSAGDVQQKIKNICMDMRVEMVQQRYTNGYNAKDNRQVLEDIYGWLQKSNVNAAYAANEREGAQTAAAYGGAKEDNWMYYNSDYYYKEEEMKNNIRQAIQEMAKEWETDAVDFEKTEKNPIYALAGGMEYNKVWQHHAFQGRVISLTDIGAVPPKGVTFFYQEKKVPGWDDKDRLEYQKGYVQVSYNHKKWSADVPYNLYGDTVAGFYHMRDFMEQYFKGGMEEECKDFLSKFDIFSEIWASTKGDSMWENCV